MMRTIHFTRLPAYLILLLLASTIRADQGPAPAKEPPKEVNGLPLLFHEDFSDGEKALQRFELLDPTDWKITTDDGRPVLSLAQKPSEKTARTPFRSPFGRAVVKDLYVGPFVMEVKLKSTVPDYNHRDLCLFFGVVDSGHLYYAHLGKKPDENCGNVFIVNDAPRKNLLPPQTRGIDWTDHYHVARVERSEDGTIQVSFDGKPWLKVKDGTFPVGRVGVGSFDDTGNFAEITVWGKKADKPAEPGAKNGIQKK